MAILSPSILAADPMNMGRDILKIQEAGGKWVHIDVMDGHFVPNHSFSPSIVSGARKVSDLFLDVHLMITEPIRYVENYCKAGADLVTVHVEADTEENIHAALDKIAELGVKRGVVVKPKTPAEAVLPFLSKCDLVLVMTVEPGFGGQKFMADMMPKVAKLRQYINEIKPDCHLEVDGGVDLVTCKVCKESGADVLVAGSAFYKAADMAAFTKEIEE
jgi:ribulose-phosphate 3-epimerase